MDYDDLEGDLTDEERRVLRALLAEAPDTTWECVQVAPMGDNHAAILFTVSDPDYVEVISLVFIVRDFEPAQSRLILEAQVWLMSLTTNTPASLCALEATTATWDWTDGQWTRRQITDTDMRRVWATPDHRILALGGGGDTLLRAGLDWRRLEAGSTAQLFDAHGRTGSLVWSCGESGTLQFLDNGRWQPIEMMRSSRFRGVDVSPDGIVRVAGDNGTCLELRDRSEVIALDAPPGVFFTVRSYQGQIYWGDTGTVYRQSGRALEALKATNFAFDLREDGDFLYSTGLRSAWRYDGEAWKSLHLTFDGATFALS